MAKHVPAYNKRSKEVRLVPEHYLSNEHPAFKDWTDEIPKTAASAAAGPAPEKEGKK